MHPVFSTTFYKNKLNRGFSLIEVLVSLSIFTIVVTISVSALYVLIEGNSRARNSQSIITNLSFALDSMTREIRTGSDFFCADDYESLPDDGIEQASCPDGGEAFAFNEGGQSLTEDMGSSRIAYRLNDTTLQRKLGDGSVADWADVTSPDIVIDTLQFYVTGADRADSDTPIVTVYIAGSAGDEDKTRTGFNIQTTIVQHLLDI